jgi:hypothetical protein
MTNQRVQPLLFVLGMNPNWGLYAPRLLELARARNLGIHVLETGAPLGTGSFTSNAVQNEIDNSAQTVLVSDLEPLPEGMKSFDDPHPSEVVVAPSKAERQDETTLAWPDTFLANAGMNEFVTELVAYFNDAGLVASGDWKPDFDMSKLPDYAKRIGARVVALPKAKFPANLIQGPVVSNLEAADLQVELLEEASPEEIASLEARADTTTTPDVPSRTLTAAMQGELPLEALIGKMAYSELRAKDGTVIVAAGETVTPIMLERARRDGIESLLIKAVEIETTNQGAPTALRKEEPELEAQRQKAAKAQEIQKNPPGL